MFDRYHDTLLIALLLLCLCAGAWSLAETSSEAKMGVLESELRVLGVSRESYFREVSCHTVRGGQKRLWVESRELMRSVTGGQTLFFGPRGEIFPQELSFQSERGILRGDGRELLLESGVRFSRDGLDLSGNKAHYLMEVDEMRLEGAVEGSAFSAASGDTLLVQADQVKIWPEAKKSLYKGNVRGRIERHRKYEKGLRFGSRELLADMNLLQLKLDGKVEVIRPRVLARGRRGEIYLKNYNKKLKYFVLYDDVEVTERVERGRNAPYNRKAHGEKLEGLPRENKIILTGYPRVYQQGDVIRGNRITLRENTEVVEVDDANTNFLLR